ncbi:MAG: c-type cytochrome [Pirellulales bacterium]|nr:c-type cytochrome [Pirellulales bacterium]
MTVTASTTRRRRAAAGKSLSFAAVAAVAASAAGLVNAQGYGRGEAVQHMTTAEGLRVELFASEPEIRQPIFVKCDDRGRLWTIQYLQYPNPAGLKRVKIDRWSRTVYDRVPEPPPHGPRGADKITILEDTDGDGRADKLKDFIDGLNLVTGVEFGHGGVFVLNVPYLLFYPDANRDDVPDADPEVLLTGFGMEDAQAMSNHLTWGPDGWLYGVNGSTTTCRIRGTEFQQGLWRYHPITKEFELFCEGGSNCYGVTFDANGECYYSTNGGPFVHAVQGGYFYKSFGKHGPLHNLYAYHYFPEVERDQVPGGPPTGGTIYGGEAFPERFRGAFVAGNFLGHTVSAWTLQPAGSTVRARFGEVLLDLHDAWSGPTDVCLAPDGSLYVSDFFDVRTAHPDPDANWDRSNGRIYKITAERGQRTVGAAPISQLASEELVSLLRGPNRWFVDRARVELAHRRDATVADELREMAIQAADNQLALEGLWALHAVTGVDDRLTLQLLEHPYQYVRSWTIRLAGDRRKVSPEVADRMASLAASEPSPIVRAQLAATAKRCPADEGLRIVEALLLHHPHESDQRIPWLIWWAVESKVSSDTKLVLETFARDAMWANPAGRDNLLRLIRRFAADGTSAGYEACLALLDSAPAAELAGAHEHLRLGLSERSVGLSGIGQGELFVAQAVDGTGAPTENERHFEPVGRELRSYAERLWRQQPGNTVYLELALRSGVDGAVESLHHAAFERSTDDEDQVALLKLLRTFGSPAVGERLIEVLHSQEPEQVKLAAVEALAAHASDKTTEPLLSAYDALSPLLRSRVREVLFSRPESALRFLAMIDEGALSPAEAPVDQLGRLALHKNEAIDALVRKHWGNIGPGSTEEKLATMRRYNNDLRPGGGDPRQGKELFTKHCAICHQLHGEGAKVGPDLTTANRQDLAALLGNIVDPSAVIRREYMNYVVLTSSGQVYSGLLAEQNAASIVVVDAKNQRIEIPLDEVESVEESEVSLMPERILEALAPQQIRDLFAYLQQDFGK